MYIQMVSVLRYQHVPNHNIGASLLIITNLRILFSFCINIPPDVHTHLNAGFLFVCCSFFFSCYFQSRYGPVRPHKCLVESGHHKTQKWHLVWRGKQRHLVVSTQTSWWGSKQPLSQCLMSFFYNIRQYKTYCSSLANHLWFTCFRTALLFFCGSLISPQFQFIFQQLLCKKRVANILEDYRRMACIDTKIKNTAFKCWTHKDVWDPDAKSSEQHKQSHLQHIQIL